MLNVEKRLKHGILDVQDKPAVKSLEEAPNGRGDSERWGPGSEWQKAAVLTRALPSANKNELKL